MKTVNSTKTNLYRQVAASSRCPFQNFNRFNYWKLFHVIYLQVKACGHLEKNAAINFTQFHCFEID